MFELFTTLNCITYLLTFNTYGSHLPGSSDGSFDRERGALDPSEPLAKFGRAAMKHPAHTLDPTEREAVLKSIQEVCRSRGWGLKAAHVRSTHVHMVVESHEAPSTILRDLKAYTSRQMNAHFGPRKRWARSGNSARLTTDERIQEAIRYVADRQGTQVAVFAA